ncbi:HofP DNA utilization family protein [Pectobacterium brasiliense]|uniref:HofP DNA utilization family protein n=1 Tax=Pectobacterium brasiliense TaxID=180957 RepID=UPI003D9B6A0C
MSHATLRITLMLLFAPHSVQAEKLAERIDPFQPLAASLCLPSATLPAWQLKGVIGSGDRWTGWLAQPEVGWIKLTRGETIPPGNWVVSQLDKSGAQLVPTAHEAGCDGLPDNLLLVSPFITKPAE